MAEGVHLGVEDGADAADLALRERGNPERLHQILHPAGRDPQHIGLLDHREEGPLGPSPRFEQRGEVAPVAHARNGQLDGAHTGVPASLAVAVAAGQAALRVTLAMRHPGELGDLGLHNRLGKHAHALTQEVGVALGDRLAHRVEQAHSLVGHRGLPPCRRFLLQRREDDAVAVLVLGHLRCDTTLWDVTQLRGAGRSGAGTCPTRPVTRRPGQSTSGRETGGGPALGSARRRRVAALQPRVQSVTIGRTALGSAHGRVPQHRRR